MFTNNHMSSRFPKHIIRTGHTALEIHEAPGLGQAQQYGGIKSIQISLDILIHNSKKDSACTTYCFSKYFRQNKLQITKHQQNNTTSMSPASSTSMKVDSLQGQKSILVIFSIFLEKRKKNSNCFN